MSRYWASWYQTTEDERPLTFPPNKKIIGWWNSGSRCSDNAWTLVALVEGKNKADAKKRIVKDWPEAKEFRFFNKIKGIFQPTSRFQLSTWMKKRM